MNRQRDPPDYKESGFIIRGGGWYGYWMLWELCDKFELNDLRKMTAIIDSVYQYTRYHPGQKCRTGGGAIPHQVLMPIPSAVIIEGAGIISQNPGYGN